MSVTRISQAKQAVNVPKADGDIDAVIVNIPSTGAGYQYDDVNIPIANLATGASTPDVGALFGSNIRGYLFGAGTTGVSDEVHAGGEEYLHKFKFNGNAVFHLHFFNENVVGTTNKGVSWYWELAFCNPMKTPTVYTGSLVHTFSDNLPAWTETIIDLKEIPSNLGLGPGSMLWFLIRRTKNASNTYTGRVHPSSAGFHCKVDSFGSRTPYHKETSDGKNRQTINHGLNRVPVGCDIVWSDKPCSVDVISATENTIEVQFDADQANVHLRIW